MYFQILHDPLKFPSPPYHHIYLKSDSLISLFQHGWLASGSHADLFIWLSCHNNKSAPQNKMCQGLGRQSHGATACSLTPKHLDFLKHLHFKFVITHLWAMENRLISNGICAPYPANDLRWHCVNLHNYLLSEWEEERRGRAGIQLFRRVRSLELHQLKKFLGLHKRCISL